MKQRFLLKSLLLLFALIVGSGSVWGQTWQKVTSEPSDWSGEYLIVYENSSTEGYCWTGVDDASCYASATISSGIISSKPSGAASVTIASMTGGYSIKVNGGDNNGKYTSNASKNGITFNTNAVANTLTYENSSVTITCGGKNFRYNSASDQKRFRYFGSAQQVVQLYKKVYTLTYSATNGSISGVVYNTSTAVTTGASIAEGDKVTLTAQPANGYEFSGWEVSGTGATLSSTSTNPTTFTMGTANATVTANFVESGAPITYSVTYNANGATSGSVPADNNSYEANDPVTIAGNTGNLAKTGNAFSGWCMNAEGTGTVYGPNNTTTFNITANTTLYAKWTPFTITAASNNNNYGTVALDGTVITATPADGYTYGDPAYTVSSGSATVVQNGNEFNVTPTSDCTVTINFAAIPTHTATFSVNGTTSSNTFYEGQAISFPSDPAAISGKSFMGWATVAISGTTNIAPSFVTSATMGNSNITYYAVFADVTGSTDASWTEMAIGSISSADVVVIVGNNGSTYALSSNGTSNAPSATSVTIKDGKIDETVTSVTDALKFNIGGNASNGYTFYPNGSTTTFIYCTDTNNGVRVGKPNANTTEIHAFTITDGYLTAGFTDARYIGIYNSSDWRCYTSKTGTSNIANQTFAFYKYIAASTTYANYCTSVAELAANAITGINDSYTVDLANNEYEVDLSGATATSGATVQYAVKSSTIDANDYELTNAGVLTVTGNGVIEIRAYVNANAQYEAAEKTVTVTVVANPYIALADETETTAYGTPYTVDEDLIEGGTVSLVSGNTAIATVSGLTITPVAVGSVTITINTAAADIWHAGTATFTLNITAPVGSATAPSSEIVLFNETFASCAGTGEAGSFSGTGSDAIQYDNSGWSAEKANAANKCGKFGSGSGAGSATTPSITVTSGSTYTLTFKAAPWSSEDETTMNVAVSGGSITGISTDAMATGEWNEYSGTITATSSAITITFSASANRFFLDDVKITEEGPAPTATVNLNKYGYATYCSQYPIDFSKTTGYTAWRVSNAASDGTITFTKITEKIKGGQGVLLYNKDADGEHTSQVTINFADGTTEFDEEENLLVGFLAPTNIAAKEYYGLSGSTFKIVGAGNVPAGKALLPVSRVATAGGGAPNFTFVFEDGGTTSIRTVDIEQLMMDDAWYDLSGRKLQSKPTAKGIYIMNGKKVVIK